MLVFIKLGGSLITDKRVENSFRETVVTRIAEEIRAALEQDASLRILIGHGSGSFGHFAAAHHGTINGVHTSEEWRAFAQVGTVAAELNYLVAKVLRSTGLPAWRVQPSASAVSHDGVLVEMATQPIQTALEHQIIPLVYGDVSLDDVRGGTIISTEKIFIYLARHLSVDRILLLGEVEGVFGSDGKVVEEINTQNYESLKDSFGSSAGVDVTGGMETKVSDMLALTELVPQLSIRIFDGRQPGLLQRVLLNQSLPGTLICIG